MFVEKKKIGNHEYFYAKVSIRIRDKVRSKTVAYLGKGLTKKEIEEKLSKIPKSKLESIKKSMKGEVNFSFLNKNQIKKIAELKKNFQKKLKGKDKELIENMFKDFKTFYIYNTNTIEGNTITLEETNLLLNENLSPKGKDLREIDDHINGREVFNYIMEKKPEINREEIIKIHSMLLYKIDIRIGKFRQHNVRILGSRFETSDWKYVQADMKILLRWYNKNKKKLHPLVLASIFHEKFERIHPFYDGNGRTGRILLNLMLMREKLPPLIIKNEDRKEYFDALSSGHKSDLDKVDSNYESIVKFCYEQLINTYSEIFSKWM